MDYEKDRDMLRGYLRDYVELITTKSKGKNMYVCPLCRSGEGANSSGAFSIKDDVSWKCFSCGEGGDIFDLIGKVEHITDHTEQIKRAKEIFGIYDAGEYKVKPHKKKQEPKAQEEEEKDYTDFFASANANINNTDYHRGISIDTLNRFNVGYVENWVHPKAPNSPATPRLIIPTGKGSYLARDTRADVKEYQKRFTKSKVGKTKIFNKEVLTTSEKPIFLVEGEIDALSIIDVGGEAIALGSTAMAKSFVELLKQTKPTQPIVLALDNDEAGEKATAEIVEGMKGLGVVFYKFNPAMACKDANELLMKDREELKRTVAEAMETQGEAERLKREEYLKNSVSNYLQSFVDGITASVDTPFIPTGFPKLDTAFDGGLYEGLYIVGAISSLGKTTLITQIADQIAQAGTDVLIFSLEMARTEIMAKSISRLTLQNVVADGGDIGDAKTARGITTGKRYAKYSENEKDLIYKSIIDYGQFSDHIFISEGIGDIGVEYIRETVRKHVLYTGNVPVVVVDYLQILAPYNDKSTDKQNTDKSVMELKRISRDYKTTVIGISSFNRTNYKEAVSMEAFKESGAIEYSSDVLIGLQLKGAGGKDFNQVEEKRKNPREIELVILKNRNGKVGDKISFEYYSLFNYFEEI